MIVHLAVAVFLKHQPFPASHNIPWPPSTARSPTSCFSRTSQDTETFRPARRYAAESDAGTNFKLQLWQIDGRRSLISFTQITHILRRNTSEYGRLSQISPQFLLAVIPLGLMRSLWGVSLTMSVFYFACRNQIAFGGIISLNGWSWPFDKAATTSYISLY